MQPLTGHAISPSMLIDLVQHYPNGTAIATPRYQLLDQSLNPLATNTVGKTGDPADITFAVMETGTTIAMNVTSDVPASLSIALREKRLQALGVDFNPIGGHCIQVFWDYWGPRGELLAEIPMGRFTFVLNSRSIAPTGNIWNLAGADLTAWLKAVCFENTYTAAQGGNVVAAALAIATMGAIEKSAGGTGQTPAGLDDAGAGLTAARVQIDPDPRTLPGPVPFTRATEKLSAINTQLLDAINYFPLFATNTGILRGISQPYYNSSNGGSTPQPVWSFTTDARSIINGPIDQTLGGAADLANVVMMESTNLSGTALFAIARNDSLSSLISRPNLKRSVMPPPINVPNCPDQTTLNLAALLALQDRAELANTISFRSAVVPGLEPNDFVGLTITNPDGTVVIGSSNYPFRLIQSSIDLDAKTMDVSLSKAVAV